MCQSNKRQIAQDFASQEKAMENRSGIRNLPSHQALKKPDGLFDKDPTHPLNQIHIEWQNHD
jgi:hypothetical protein